MTSDKAYSAEARLGSLWNHLGPFTGGGNGQRQSGIASATPQSIVTAVGSYLNVTGMSWPVLTTGVVRIRAFVLWTQGPNGNQQNFRFTGPATSAGRYTGVSLVNAGAVGMSSSTALSTAITSQSVATGSVVLLLISGEFTFTATGTLQFQAGEGGTGGSLTITDGDLTCETVGQTT